MEGSNFVDYVKLFCRSGNGGKGIVHFHRDKLTTKGGPDGGDGGRGGHVIVRGNKQLWTLLHLKYRKHIHAKNGVNGGAGNSTGAGGEDIILEVPLGTVAKNAANNESLFEITLDGEEKILCKGGRGGLGNSNFATATNQAPMYSQEGETGEEGWKILELKLLADVGLVGFPNAGKSTLLSVVSAARPEIASYAFTTLVPNLGIVSYHDNRSFVMADLPGIIEGAHLGKGLGHRFLRHIERNSMLLFLIPSDSADIRKEYEVLIHELNEYNPELLHKPRLLAVSKGDLIDDELENLLTKELPADIPASFHLFRYRKKYSEDEG
jgi:GTP-binding protein